MANKMKVETRKIPPTLPPERQKRLLPYITYYLNRNHQKPLSEPRHQIADQQKIIKTTPPQEPLRHDKFTPFLESNALPGPFIPIIKNTQKNIDAEYISEQPQIEKNPDFSAIYDTLVQLKHAQQVSRPPALQRQNLSPVYRKPQINRIPTHYYENQQYQTVQPVKTIIETYTPTNIDISGGEKNYNNVPATMKNYNEHLVYKVYSNNPQVDGSYVVENPRYDYSMHDYEQGFTTSKPYFGEKLILRRPVILFQEKPTESGVSIIQQEKEHVQNEKPIVHVIQTTKPQANAITEEKYVAHKFTPIAPTQGADYENAQMRQYSPVQFITEKYEPKYEQQYYSTPVPKVVQEQIPTENTNILGKILKQLQNSNTLPHTLTAENIDNSIRTLIKILNGLRKQQRLKTKPIVVADENSEEDDDDEDDRDDEVIEEPNYVPGTITQSFPANTVEGGTPGRPGIDYPALSTIPQTSFNCKTQRYKGFFGDPHTNCQVWHYCDLNGGQASFLCPNGTIFSQVALTCDWWYNVKCSTTPQLYVLNERLYKYILPLAPKFPEDYSGPLVDRYLALKFKEMEEKMKNEKKKDEKSEEVKDDSDQLQDIQNEKAKSEET
ncbi:uncharacterized protein BDFB_006702 [Asbolus verrucosus]|uniref:Chitin-binding type-2 domain-containing protein n=1 Tax=Asbolus verrucosus TaxID=1661398 RepID=A0A482VE41_ASBVE|nr:uncharacterized protein BDFB_006702 [Asbolus verrucosus]